MTKAHWRKFVRQWEHAGPELERIRREELRQLTYDPRAVSDLLDLGDRFPQRGPSSGLVEMQKGLRLLAEKQGLLGNGTPLRRTPGRGEPADPGSGNP